MKGEGAVAVARAENGLGPIGGPGGVPWKGLGPTGTDRGPGGTTEKAVNAFLEGDIMGLFNKAMNKALERATEMAKEAENNTQN